MKETVVDSGVSMEIIVGLEVTVPSGVKFIASAFNGLESVAKVTLPETVEIIGDYSFYRAIYLREVDLSGTSVSYIGSNAYCR